MEIRLQKWLSQAGIASRRKAEELILSGLVSVNGEIVIELGVRADTAKDIVAVDGKPCEIPTQKVYIAMHKPEGVITTVLDPYSRPTVMDYIPREYNCFPVGRLDYDTSGLLIMTNDGNFAQMLTHPKHEVTKTYIAIVKGLPRNESLEAFRSGLTIEGKPTAPAQIEIIKKTSNAKVRIKLREGRNRQVRKMCEAIGHPILSLKRVEIGSIKLGPLPRGEWRHLTQAELKILIAPIASI
ncbi:MAG: rRNA pseudouridine synthase [Defluviitaleaceae bacterium]|nr:rRNA pseudouridine synthase [Defluviitaleaceae bacterium]